LRHDIADTFGVALRCRGRQNRTTGPEPASIEFIRRLHRGFYRDAAEEMPHMHRHGRNFTMQPGEWRSRSDQDVAVGRHIPPSSARVADFTRPL
jgi:Fic family protein